MTSKLYHLQLNFLHNTCKSLQSKSIDLQPNKALLGSQLANILPDGLLKLLLPPKTKIDLVHIVRRIRILRNGELPNLLVGDMRQATI